MPVRIVAYHEELVGAVKAFNTRLAAGGVVLQFPESPVSPHLPRAAGRQTYEEYFVAEDNGAIRGGYVLKHQPFCVNGWIGPVGNLQLPISEGTIDKAYGRLGTSLFADALRRVPRLYLLGMGGLHEPVVRLLRAMQWPVTPVPFYFRVIHPTVFLREIVYLRTSRLREAVLNALAGSGLGWAAIGLAQAVRRKGRGERGVHAEVVDEFGAWCDDLWQRCRDEYVMSAVRDGQNLLVLYPKEHPRYIRLKVSRDGAPIGWAVVLATRMSGHKQLGGMKVGSIVDCLAAGRDAESVARAATEHLEEAGVDLIVSNQSAAIWGRALDRCGYLRGPSNFVFAPSKDLARLLEPLQRTFPRIHLTRGDGEGPTNL